MTKLGTCSYISLVAAAVVSPVTSQAQAVAQVGGADSPAAQQSDPSADPDNSVPDIVVTALKHEQTLQSVAGAVSALGRESIERQGITDVTSLQFHVPSLVAGGQGPVTAVSIRGVGLNQFSTLAQPGVAVHVDGVYQARLASSGQGQIDLERIEVLRGPQGTLYGRNATGGAVNFITAAPSDRFESSALAGLSSYDEFHLNGLINVPLTEGLRTRLVVDYTKRNDGFAKNVIRGGPDADKGSVLTGRFKLSADLGPDLAAELSVHGQRQRGAFAWLQLTAPPGAAIVAANPILAGAIVPPEPHVFSIDQTPYSNSDAYGATLTLSAKLGAVKLKSISAISAYAYDTIYDADGTNIAFSTQANRLRSRTGSQELNLSGETSGVSWLLGAFYMDDDFHTGDVSFKLPSGSPAAGIVPGGGVTLTGPYRVRSAAVFTDDTINLSSRLRLIVGARYSSDKVSVRELNTINGLEIAPGIVLPALPTCDNIATEVKFHSFTPRGGVQWDISRDVGSYVTVSRGFKDGGVDASSCNVVYKPEHITAYEAGLRMRFFDKKLTINPTIFYYDYTDFQVSQFTGISSQVVNAPKATVKGLEVEIVYAPNRHISVNGGLTLLDATYQGGFRNLDTLNPALGMQNLDGNRLSRAPEFSGTLGAEYATTATSLGRFIFRGDVYASSRVYYREFNALQDSQAPYALVNLAVIWDSPDRRYNARIYAKNIGNERVLAQLGSSDFLGSRFATYAPPRQIGAEARVRF